MFGFTPLRIAGTISLINYSFYSWENLISLLCGCADKGVLPIWQEKNHLARILSIFLIPSSTPGDFAPKNCLFGALDSFLCLRLYSRLSWEPLLLRMYLTFVQIIYFLLFNFFPLLGCSGCNFPLSVHASCFLCFRAVRMIQLLPGQCIAYAEHGASGFGKL